MTRHGICPPAAFFTETMPSTAPRRRNAWLNRGEVKVIDGVDARSPFTNS